jgi:selenocysteine lyase/cysteine desulfurase
VLPLLQLSRRIGLRVEFIPDGEEGTVDRAAFARMLDDDVRLVSAVHAPSHNGLINDVAGLGQELTRSGSSAWYVVDACQSLGQLPVDVGTIRCDFLLASGRKFLRGPRGTGLLYAGDRALRELDAFPVDIRGARWNGGGDFALDNTATRFETFERSVAAGLGLMAAARYAAEVGIDPMAEAIARNAEYLRARLSALPGWHVLDRGTRRSGIVVARHTTADPGELVARLRRERVNTHVVPPDSSPRDLGSAPAIRLSPHAFNNQYDLDRALRLIAELTG